MEVNFKKYLHGEDNTLKGMVLACVGELQKTDRENNTDIVKQVANQHYIDTGNIDIKIQLNGIEVDPIKFFELMDRSYIAYKEKALKELNLTDIRDQYDQACKILKYLNQTVCELTDEIDYFQNMVENR